MKKLFLLFVLALVTVPGVMRAEALAAGLAAEAGDSPRLAGDSVRAAALPREAGMRSPAVAMLCSAVPLIPGGQFYNGEYRKGLEYVGVNLASVAFIVAGTQLMSNDGLTKTDYLKMGIGNIVGMAGAYALMTDWWWSMADARAVADELNRGVRPVYDEGYRPLNPMMAAAMSVLVPGAGQFYTGDRVGGLAHFVLGAGSAAVMLMDYVKWDNDPMHMSDGGYRGTDGDAYAWASVVYVANAMWSAIEAGLAADRLNRAAALKGRPDVAVSLRPDVLVTPSAPSSLHAGLTCTLSF